MFYPKINLKYSISLVIFITGHVKSKIVWKFFISLSVWIEAMTKRKVNMKYRRKDYDRTNNLSVLVLW